MKISLGMDVTYRLEEISNIARQFLTMELSCKVIAFHGEMGAGKTTFIHEICHQLQVQNNVSSPTFSIINEYICTDGTIIYHMDLYRIKNAQEAIEAGVEACFDSGRLCLVEWPEKAPGLFTNDTVHVYLSVVNEQMRKLKIKL